MGEEGDCGLADDSLLPDRLRTTSRVSGPVNPSLSSSLAKTSSTAARKADDERELVESRGCCSPN